MITRDQLNQLSFSDVFQLIKVGERELSVFCESLSEDAIASRIKPLREVIETIGSSVVRRPPPLERYILQWEAYLSGQRKNLDPAAVRCLCWEAEISMDYRFIRYLEKAGSVMGPRSLVGLVRSCHNKWDSVSGIVIDKVRTFVMQYDGPNKVVNKWKLSPKAIAHQNGPMFLAKSLATAHSIDELVTEWYLEPQSVFLQHAVRGAALLCRQSIGETLHSSRRLFESLLPWRGWKIKDFKAEIQDLILHRDVNRIQEQLQGFVLTHKDLGDPRLPRNRDKNWVAISPNAVSRFVEMLCREDIRFFFDYVYSTGGDKHMRKEFWLRYVGRCVASRPLLTPSDKVKLKSVLGTKMGQPGEIRSGLNSAFMLDFGEITVVEFSRIGACYIYESHVFKKLVRDFWSPHPFVETRLKNKLHCINRIRHLNTCNIDWRNEVRNILAQWGIRPGVSV